MNVDIKVQGARDYLDQVAGKIENMAEVMGLIGEIVQSSVERNFEVGGRYSSPGSYKGGGSKWKDLANGTKKARKRKGKWPGPILQVSGRLAGSIHYNAHNDKVEVGTNLVYAAIHEFGGTINRAGGPGSVRLRSRQGKLVRQGKEGKLANLAVFSSSKHSHVVRSFVGKPYTITIPARPFLVVQDEDLEEIVRAVQEFLV